MELDTTSGIAVHLREVGYKQERERFRKLNNLREDEVMKARSAWAKRRDRIINDLACRLPLPRESLISKLANPVIIGLLGEYFANEADIGILGRLMRDFYDEATTPQHRLMMLNRIEKILSRRKAVYSRYEAQPAEPQVKVEVEAAAVPSGIDALIMGQDG